MTYRPSNPVVLVTRRKLEAHGQWVLHKVFVMADYGQGMGEQEVRRALLAEAQANKEEFFKEFPEFREAQWDSDFVAQVNVLSTTSGLNLQRTPGFNLQR